MENNNGNKLKMIVQAGAVGLSILLIGLATFMFNKYDKMANNHTTEFMIVIKENTATQERLLGAINTWGEEINDLSGSMQAFMNYVAPQPF